MKKKRQGFTLIELLVVISILVVVTGAIAACLAGGIRVWDAAQRFNDGEMDTIMGLELLERDVRNTFRFHAIDFSGDTRSSSFAGLMNAKIASPSPVGGIDPGRRLATVRYYFNANRHALLREKWVYLSSETSRLPAEPIISGLRDINISYFKLPVQEAAGDARAYTGGSSSGEWLDYWSEGTNLPAALRIELDFLDEDRSSLVRTFLIPTSEAQPAE